MQKVRTLQFWDTFYVNEEQAAAPAAASSDPNNHIHSNSESNGNINGTGNSDSTTIESSPTKCSNKEWILQPSDSLFQLILQHLDPSTTSTSTKSCEFLEIGCGTSTLARDLYLYLVQTRRQNDNNNNSQDRVKAVASDVSEVCILQNQARDEQFLREAKGAFQYNTLNILDTPVPEEMRSRFDWIIDKGCLDTFLFRTRHRGGRRKEILMKTVLDNLHCMLRQNDDDDDDQNSNNNSRCCLLILSPRSKVRVIREHPGFVCEKHELDRTIFTDLIAGELDGGSDGAEKRKNKKKKKSQGKQQQHQQQQQQEEESPQEEKVLYLYVCRKRHDYDSSTPLPTRNYDLSDNDTCPACSMTFETFRGGHKNLDCRGKHVWFREWTGHLTHCKGTGADGGEK